MPGSCPRCEKQVYFAEEKIVLGKSWHKTCFRCAECRKTLDSTNCTEHANEVYCKSCYGRNFGPKGYGFGGGAGVLSMDTGEGHKNGPTTRNIPATAQAHVAPNNAASKPAGNKPRWGGSDMCGRCGQAVFMAEKMMGGGSAWHKRCFTCKLCNKLLQSTSLCERDGELYCKACYGRNFGPKGYGFGVGAGTLTMQE
ncbi:Cysteine and glycine-rich protein 3 [Nymphon striatum]|nr:Cysteine and glycine-rich protein 3 [Nymphon striatum]